MKLRKKLSNIKRRNSNASDSRGIIDIRSFIPVYVLSVYFTDNYLSREPTEGHDRSGIKYGKGICVFGFSGRR